MLVWLTLPLYDFCGFRSVAVNSVYKLQFFYIYPSLTRAIPERIRGVRVCTRQIVSLLHFTLYILSRGRFL